MATEWIDVCGDGGLLKKVVKEGLGDFPEKGSEVEVHYIGTLADGGSKFDSSRDRNETFKFDLGGGVIKGWNEGVVTMRPGERCILRCRSDYAYGDKGSPPNIPGGATLDFDIEFFNSQEKWEHTWPVEHKFLDKPNSTYNLPKEESIVTFNLEVFKDKKCSQSLYKENDITIEIGDTEDRHPKFVHDLIERCAEGNTVLAKLDLPKFVPLPEWNVTELNSYFIIIKTLNSKDALALWNMTLDQKREEAIRRKDKGNDFFKLKNFKKALKHYKKGISALDDFFKSTKSSDNKDGMLDDSTDSENDDIKHEPTENDEKLFVTLQSNAGMMCLKLKENKNALDHASEGLRYDGNHMKCLTRKAQAELKLGLLEEAEITIDRCLALDQNNNYCILLKKNIQKQIREYKRKQKALATKMFS